MNIQIFGKSKCFDTKKAERYFKERRIPFQSIDLKTYGMSGRNLTVTSGGWAALTTSSTGTANPRTSPS